MLISVSPSARDVGGAAATSIRLSREARETVLAKSLSRREGATVLGVTPQAVSEELRTGALVGRLEGARGAFPHGNSIRTSQEAGSRELINFGPYPGGPVSLSLWERSTLDLGGICPLEAIRRGRLDEVLALLSAAKW